jgi:hypothetical protein
LLIGKPHPVTVAIARMHPDDQDVIDDFLLSRERSGESLKGQLLTKLIKAAIDGTSSPNEQAVAELLPAELLKMAQRFPSALWRPIPKPVSQNPLDRPNPVKKYNG